MFSNIESAVYAIFLASIAVVAVMNPFGNLPQFIAMTDGMPVKIRKHLFRNIVITAFVIVMIFLFAGPLVMDYMFRVSLNELRIAGGLILVVMGIKNLLFTNTSTRDFAHYQNMSEDELIRRSIIPMAFPMAKQYSQKMKGFVDFELRCCCILPIPPYIGETKSEVLDSCPAPGSLCMGRVGSILLASASMAL